MKLTKTKPTLLACFLFCSSVALVYGGSNDPLDPAETSIAAQLAAPSNAVSTRTRSLAANAATSSTLAPAVLLIERHPAGKNQTARLADVYTYYYDSHELERSIVNLDTNTLVESERAQGIQLPLTASELQRATEALFADDEHFKLIDAEHRRILGQPLRSLDQLNVKAFVFHGYSLPQQVNPASAECGVRRCAQLLLYTPENIVFELSPIVDLSSGIVTQVIGF